MRVAVLKLKGLRFFLSLLQHKHIV